MGGIKFGSIVAAVERGEEEGFWYTDTHDHDGWLFVGFAQW